MCVNLQEEIDIGMDLGRTSYLNKFRTKSAVVYGIRLKVFIAKSRK